MVFWDIELGTNKCIVVLAEQQDAAILLPLIRQYVVPETTVVSNRWAAYSTIKGVPEGHQHETVNHTLYFIDPETGAYTNTIESLWRKFEEGHETRYGTEKALLQS